MLILTSEDQTFHLVILTAKSMIDALFSHVSQYAKLTARDKMLIRNNVEVKTFKQGEFLFDFGEVTHEIGFISDGVLRSFYFDESEKEMTTNFFQKNDFVISFSSFYNLRPLTEAVQVEIDSSVLLIDRNNYNLFADRIPSWQYAFGLVANNALLSKTNFQREVINLDTTAIYLNFVKNYPELLKTVPLGHIASFLGMTQSTLSRVRKKIVS